MRYMTIFGILTLTAALWSPAPCAAQQVPGGSYQQTCSDIGVRGSTLYATCDNGRGARQSTELRDFQNCSGEIQNINGNLQCKGNTGSYQGRDGNRHNRDHGQYDRDQNGNRDQNGDRGQYGNRDQDNDRGNYNGPSGSYSQSCQNISTNGNTLQASCQKKNGGWRQTSLRNYNRCNGDIANNNGKLQCSR
jgi:hypothetical protein